MSRAEQKAATRERIIAEAQKAFHHNGYGEVNVRDLASAAQVSTGCLYGHWVDKAALFEEAMGFPAPDPVAFLERVAVSCAGRGPELQNLADDAMALRRHLIGSHS